jgi:predicted dienelactone hydrolase
MTAMLPPALTSTCLAALIAISGHPHPDGYDPLAVTGEAAWSDDSVHDADRDRTLPVRIHRADRPEPLPVVLFSHGLGGSREGAAYLGRHWASRGYVAVFLQHPGSDEAIWKDLALRDRLDALRAAASLENLALRVGDVSAVLDALERWNRDETHPLFERLDLERVALAGHSFGARTTQAVGGQRDGRVPGDPCDPRIDAALPLSPSSPFGVDLRAALSEVSIPWMLMTGTDDQSPIGGQSPASRLEVFPALPPTVDRYQLVLFGAEHSAFSDSRQGGRVFGKNRDPDHHPAILALSTAFLDTHLRDDPAARAWLHGDGPRELLDPRDGWEVREAVANEDGPEPRTQR